MKKNLVLILATLMCISLCACGGANSTTESNKTNSNGKKEENESKKEIGTVQDIRLEEIIGDGETHYKLCFPSYEVLYDCIKKVELTQDNWKYYFEDYDVEVEHIVETNSFGDVEREYDLMSGGFGLKKTFLASGIENVAFKFDGKKVYVCDRFVMGHEPEYQGWVEWGYILRKINEDKAYCYDGKTNEFITKVDYPAEEYFLVEGLESSTNAHYMEFNCLAVKGTLLVLELPEGLYNGETIIKYAVGEDEFPVYFSSIESQIALWFEEKMSKQ